MCTTLGFFEGTKAFAYELWEQCAELPDEILFPVGNGTLIFWAFTSGSGNCCVRACCPYSCTELGTGRKTVPHFVEEPVSAPQKPKA